MAGWLRLRHIRTLAGASLHLAHFARVPAHPSAGEQVRTPTGHGSSQMISRYRREAQTAAELQLGWLKPLYLAVPELRKMDERPRLVLVGRTDIANR